MNIMRQLRIEKITLNIGAGKDQARLEKGIKLLKMVTGIEPVKTMSKKRIPGWGLRVGLPIGCKLTLRKDKAIEILKNLLMAKENKLYDYQFDNLGNLAFGLSEYVDIPNMKYNPEIGIMGLEICVTMERPGFRVKTRRLKTKKIPQKHRISKNESIDFMKNEFNIKVLANGEE
ncbi:50S ribosomal protein L5 [Candidatus Woesearchaeota archaeon]|nr:50S ribosomal protein L5 [Candidatus Woesearchaeota archaeon]